MSEFTNNRRSVDSSIASSNKDPIETLTGMLRGGAKTPRRVQNEELGEFIGNGQPRHDSLADEEDDTTTEASSAQSQPVNPTQPKILPELIRTGSHRPKGTKFPSSGSTEL